MPSTTYTLTPTSDDYTMGWSPDGNCANSVNEGYGSPNFANYAMFYESGTSALLRFNLSALPSLSGEISAVDLRIYADRFEDADPMNISEVVLFDGEGVIIASTTLAGSVGTAPLGLIKGLDLSGIGGYDLSSLVLAIEISSVYSCYGCRVYALDLQVTDTWEGDDEGDPPPQEEQLQLITGVMPMDFP